MSVPCGKYLAWAVLAFALVGCNGNDAGSAAPGGKGAGAPPLTEVDVIVVKPADAILTVELPGRVQAVRSAQIRARVEGVLEKQLVPDGAEVAPGTPLFQIDARAYQAAFDAAEADHISQQAILARYQALLATKAISAQEFDAATSRAKSAAAALAKARLDLEYSQPRTPIQGRAGRALVTEGALVGKGDATHLMTVEQLNPIRVEFSQPYSEVLALQKQLNGGGPPQAGNATIVLLHDDGTEHPRSGVLKFNDMAVDPMTGSVTLRAEFANPARTLLPGTFVRVRLPVGRQKNALRVPQRAVSTSAQGQAVLVVDEQGSVATRPISTQGMAGTDYLVTVGLKAGEQVIVNGLQKTRPGAVVKPVLISELTSVDATSPTAK